VSAYWAEIPGPSSRVGSWLRPWQQCWQQSSTRLQSDVFVCCDSADLARQLSVSSRARLERSRLPDRAGAPLPDSPPTTWQITPIGR
jgi:hypothetical protein